MSKRSSIDRLLVLCIVAQVKHFSHKTHITRLRDSTRMLPLASITIATIFVGITASVSSKVCGDEKRDKREVESSSQKQEALNPLQRESSAEEMATVVGLQNVGYEGTGSYVSELPRQAIGWRDAVPGTPGMDYPNLDEIPVTSFTCMDKEPGGYYADVETGCQVFHVCNTGGVKSSFLCPPGSIFNQKHFVCDWWYGFNCQEAENFYFTKSKTNFADEDKIVSVIENHETTTPVFLEFSSEKNFQDSTIQNDVNPQNDGSFTSNRRLIIDHSSRDKSKRIDDSFYHPKNVHKYPIDSRSHENFDNDPIEDHKPRGFSRDDKKSLKRRKFNFEMSSRDSTNDLASYVNYAYFQAGFNDNRNHDDEDNDDHDDNDDIRKNFDVIKLEDDSENERHFGSRLMYKKNERIGYSEMEKRPGTQSFKNFDEFE